MTSGTPLRNISRPIQTCCWACIVITFILAHAILLLASVYVVPEHHPDDLEALLAANLPNVTERDWRAALSCAAASASSGCRLRCASGARHSPAGCLTCCAA